AGLTALVNLGVAPDEIDLGGALSLPPWLPVALYVSAANLGAGLLSGKGGLPFALGGMLAWWIVAPLAVGAGWMPAPANPVPDVAAWQAGEIYGQMLRPLGIGMLIGGALAGIAAALPAVRAAMSSLGAAAALAAKKGASPEEVDASWVRVGAVVGVLLLWLATWLA